MVFRGAYEVPDAELPRLVRSAHAHKVAWAHLGPALAALVVFSVALAAGARLTDADLQLSRGAYRVLPGIVFSGSFCMAAIAAALCSRLRSGSFARRNLGGLRYDRWAHRFHFDDRLGRSARAKLGGALLGVVGLVVTIYVTWTIEEFAASPPALRLYSLLSCVIFLAIFAGLAAAVIGELGPGSRWTAASSWTAGDSISPGGGREAKKARPLWRRLLVPLHGSGLKGFLLDALHIGIYTVVLVSIVVVTMNWWDDRRPADADVLAFFAEATRPPERNPDLAPVVLKWTTGPAVYQTGGDPEREGEELDEALHTLSLTTGLDWHRAASAESADVVLEILYGPEEDELPEDIDQGTVNYSFDRRGALTGGRMKIAGRDQYRVILHWGLAEIAGLRGDTSAGGHSVTSGAQSFTALDRAALLVLYNAGIEPGMAAEQANENAREIVAAWPDANTVTGLREALARP
jgi:hypothetical protein